MIRIALIFTSTTQELETLLKNQLNEALQGVNYHLLEYHDPSILQDIKDAGGVTEGSRTKLIALYDKAVEDDATILLNVCSSVGDIAKDVKPIYKAIGVKVIRIDEDMAMAAVQAAGRIGVVATLTTTLEPTKRLLTECAKKAGRQVILVDCLVEGIFQTGGQDFAEQLTAACQRIRDDVDVMLFAQGSMAFAERTVADNLQMPVYSSIRFAVVGVKNHCRNIINS